MEIRYFDPLKELGSSLLSVEKPARYTGGEYGRLIRAPEQAGEDGAFHAVIAFPDLYEIGMSNQALRILYNRLNGIKGVSCDRAFAPAPDFEALLRKSGSPLYGLDSGISLKSADLLLFTLGYELGFGGIFTMLDVSGIPLRCDERGEDDPVVIMGGPCVSNPLPYSHFIDAFWIGEAEAGFFELAEELGEIKKTGGRRSALLKRLLEHPSVWARGKGRAVRAVDSDFSFRSSEPPIFPIPSMKIVHQHASVEIMRGCPNGCRFCHAGFWYRPMRQKDAAAIKSEVESFIRRGGYREISLYSLSSGDYQHLDNLIDNLNNTYRSEKVSFQLPSLKVSGFSLDLLEKISDVRKSGLTFAIETPSEFGQMAINKMVSEENVVAILKEAKRRGWKGAKFYFMIGLPLKFLESENQAEGIKPEEEEIAIFVERVAKKAGMTFNINVGTFVPKSHTPFQWAGQLDSETAFRKLMYIKNRLKAQGHKVGVQDPFVSLVEGLISRGDERVGELFLKAFLSGCRLDAWSEYFNKDVWKSLIEENKALCEEVLKNKDFSSETPWSCVSSLTSSAYQQEELEKSKRAEITSQCINNCTNPCGTCNKNRQIVQNHIQHKVISNEKPQVVELLKMPNPPTLRLLFSFSKQGTAVLLPHLALLEVFAFAFTRALIPVSYTQGFNPLPRLDIASPLSLGIRACGEIATVDTDEFFLAEDFKEKLNCQLPEGLKIAEVSNISIPFGVKKHSVCSLLWGYSYSGENGAIDFVKAEKEKAYRFSRSGEGGSVFGLQRLEVLAKPADGENAGAAEDKGLSYFEAYRRLYN